MHEIPFCGISLFMKKRIKLKIDGMSCAGDCDSLAKNFSMDGVIEHSIDLQNGEAWLTFDSTIIDPKDLRKIMDGMIDFKILEQTEETL